MASVIGGPGSDGLFRGLRILLDLLGQTFTNLARPSNPRFARGFFIWSALEEAQGIACDRYRRRSAEALLRDPADPEQRMIEDLARARRVLASSQGPLAHLRPL